MEHEPSRWRRSLGPLALLASCAVVLAPLAFGGVLGGVDVLRQELDFRSLLSEALGAFELPHWNPYVLCGTPHLASMSGGPLHPLHLALAPWLSPAAAINVSVALSLIAAAFGAWLLARRLAEHRAAALAGGLLFALGGVMLGHLEAGHVSLVATYALLPWVALALDRLQQRPEPARLLVAGVALALFVLSGHPQLIVLGGLGLVALLRLRSWLSPAHRGPRRWVFIAASGGLGALLSAHQWLPALHFAARSGRARSDDPLFHQLGTFAARDLLQLLAPATLGPRPGALPWETCAFIGVVGLTLALAAALTRQKGALALCALAGLATGLAFGPLQAVIPGLSLFRVPGRFVVLLALALAALAVWGLAAAGPRLTLAAAGVVAALALSLGLALEAELVSVAGYALRVALPLAALGALSVAALRGRLALERWRWLVVGLLTVELVIGGMGRLRTRPPVDHRRLHPRGERALPTLLRPGRGVSTSAAARALHDPPALARSGQPGYALDRRPQGRRAAPRRAPRGRSGGAPPLGPRAPRAPGADPPPYSQRQGRSRGGGDRRARPRRPARGRGPRATAAAEPTAGALRDGGAYA
ncbi:MAG: hypothetical protein CSB49_01890 [Proteobacteria bacterium]|nr:MAG: hypothetical protein CSB49_01890 [Pseudomonadota bacterium]